MLAEERVSDKVALLDAETFAAGMKCALTGVVSIAFGSGPETSNCTGWVLTPQLVLIPGYAVPENASSESSRAIRVRSAQDPRIVLYDGDRPTLTFVGKGAFHMAGAGPAIALLRLRKSYPARTLTLSFDVLESGAFLGVLQCPLGHFRAHVSFGSALAIAGNAVGHDAGTLPGSSGAPMFDNQWRVVAVHVGAEGQHAQNQGMTLAGLLEVLAQSPLWSEIAEYHRIVDLDKGRKRLEAVGTNAITGPPGILIRAALSSTISWRSLSKANRDRLRPHVVDSAAKLWVLQPEMRRQVIRSVGSFESLRKHLPRNQQAGTAQKVIERIVTGPPYDLDNADEESLSWWIQAARWFADIEPSLPSPRDITRRLERRRVRSRLEAIAGREFQGRVTELRLLRNWFWEEPAVPLVLTGIGGIGKSSLVARFASMLPTETLLLWLDFDRADLAPDDAGSVLKALGDQIAVQLDGFAPFPVTDEEGLEAAKSLGKQLATLTATLPPSLLVLDSFEVAQYVVRYQELWPVLEAIAREVPALRLLVTGRAPLEGLRFQGRLIKTRHLQGLKRAEVRRWLRKKKVTQPRVLERVLDLADGIPLNIRLALRLIEMGGRVKDLPKKLPPEIVAGFLYDRILDRVQNPMLKPLLSAALVLRRLTPEMIQPVFGGLVELPPGDPIKWFPDLAREMDMVEGTDVLRLRPELRTAALRTLQRHDPKLVAEVEARAEKWYAHQNSEEPEIVAEQIYHRLRRGDIAGAQSLWRDECSGYLLYAPEELPKVSRAWLEARLGTGDVAKAAVSDWEMEAATRIRSSRKRGLKRAIGKILEERTDRSAISPLLFDEAFELRSMGQHQAALTHLASAAAALPSGSVGRDTAMLHALLAAEAGNRREAQGQLAPFDEDSRWSDRRSGHLEALAVRAARIQMTTDLDGELHLLRLLADGEKESLGQVQSLLAPIDAVLPLLAQRLRIGPRLETASRWSIANDPSAMSALEARVEMKRMKWLAQREEEHRRRSTEPHASEQASAKNASPSATIASLAQELSSLAIERWKLVTTTTFLFDACTIAKRGSMAGDPLFATVLGSLALFAGEIGQASLIFGSVPLFDLLQLAGSYNVLTVPVPRLERAMQLLKEGVDPGIDWPAWLAVFHKERTTEAAIDVEGKRILHAPRIDSRGRALAFHLLAPDPLRQLVRSLASSVDLVP